MTRMRAIVIGVSALALLGAGGVVAGSLQDTPQEARPAQDPIGDILRDTPQTPPTPAPTTPGTPVEPAPSAELAPAAPIIVIPTEPIVIAVVPDEDEKEEAAPPPAKIVEPSEPTRRQRRRVAIVEAIDKVTARSMRFEVVVGGRPVRFNKQLVFTARACEVSAIDEPVEDAVAYLDVVVEPRAGARGGEAREIFKGWMFASTPAVSGLQHPIYDAWVIGCKA